MNADTNNLGEDENFILLYLNHWPEMFISGTEVARQAAGIDRYVDDPRWSGLAMSNLMEMDLVESDGHDKYRIKQRVPVAHGGQRRFIAPHLKEILEKHRRKFSRPDWAF
jgi:hypothetical protein